VAARAVHSVLSVTSGMWRPGRDDLKLLLESRIRRLGHKADPGLVWFCIALLALDLFFIAAFSYRMYTALYTNEPSRLSSEWHIGRDWSYAEILGYVKLAMIVSVLILISAKWRQPMYLALVVIFTVALLDDALQLHERLGDGVTDALALQSPVLGELMIWTMFGAFLLAVTRAGFVRTPQEDRNNGFILLGAFGVLVFFAVVVDLVHVVVLHGFRYRTVDRVLTTIEEGGEQIILTLICGLVLLIRRELHSREA
jgi:hypothetical protein